MSKKTLVNESVIHRWGKLANMAPLTETWLNEQDEEEDVEAAAEDEIAAGEEEIEGGMEAEADVEETEAVERIVNAVVDAIADETGVDIEVESDSEGADQEAMDDIDDSEDAGDVDLDAGDDEMDAAMRDPYNRRELDEKKKKKKKKKDDDDWGGNERDFKRRRNSKGVRKKTGDVGGGKYGKGGHYKDYEKNESLNIDVIDDEDLTEAVLQRVVERLLRKQ